MTGLVVAAIVWLVAAVIAAAGFGFAARATRRARMYAAGAEDWRQALAATEPGDVLTALAEHVDVDPEPTYRDEPVVRPYMLGGWVMVGASKVHRGCSEARRDRGLMCSYCSPLLAGVATSEVQW